MIEQATVDVLVVGAGIVGLAHAARAAEQGRSVCVVDREHRPVGASIRNFGHVCVTAQSGDLLDLAMSGRRRWIDLGACAGFEVAQTGAVIVARTETELALLGELASARGDQVTMLSAAQVKEATGVISSGGARLRDDLRVDPRTAAPTLADWLGNRHNVEILWNTAYFGNDGPVAQTSRGAIRAEQTFVCVGHDLDQLQPDLAQQHGIRRCSLQMAAVEAPVRIRPAVLTGTSMLRYPAFTELAAAERVRAEIRDSSPQLLDIDANVMLTQRPDGTLLVGDSHHLDASADPFLHEDTSDILLTELAALLQVPLRVRQRWQGVYAASPSTPYVIADLGDDVTAVSVTTGVGMTIAHGLAVRNLP